MSTSKKTAGTGARTGIKWVKRIGMGFAGLALLAGGAAAVMELRSPRMRAVDTSKKVAVTPERVARGRYLVEGVAHCMRCHSDHDWKMHGAPEVAGLSGAGWDVPWRDNKMPGPVFATNLTPDPETGLGNVPDDAIARAIREGVGHDGRALFMMPWQNFRGFSDEEVASIIAYLRSIPAVRKPRGATKIVAPVRWFLKAAPQPLDAPVAAADESSPVARGRRLAELGQCQTCHTPVDARHQPLAGMAFAGGQEFVIDGVTYRSPNITPDASGIAHYDEALFVRTMRTGNVGSRRLAPIMPWLEIRQLSDDDLKALWAYLKTVRPIAHDVERTDVTLADNPAIDEAATAVVSNTPPGVAQP